MAANYEGDTPTLHARRSAQMFGGTLEDYVPVHTLHESARLHLPGARHRALLHTTLGVQTAEEVFGLDLQTGSGAVSTREVTEAHIRASVSSRPSRRRWTACRSSPGCTGGRRP